MKDHASHEVVITGIGMYCAMGSDTASVWCNILNHPFCVRPIPQHWHDYADLQSRIWAPLPILDFGHHHLGRAEKIQLDMAQMLVIAAAQEALSHAGLHISPDESRKSRFNIPLLSSPKTGVFIGTGSGGLTSLISSQAHHTFSPVKRQLEASPDIEKNSLDRIGQLLRLPSRFNPFVVSMMMPNACSSSLGIRFGLTGQNETCCVACSSGTAAIGHAFRAIEDGTLDCALSGGTEYLGDEYGGIFRSFDSAGTLVRGSLPSGHCPFDVNRSGFLFSEGGAAVLVLESLDHAQRRGAAILAKITEFSEIFDPYSSMNMEPNGLRIEEMLREVLDSAAIQPSQVNYINSHGTGTIMNDEVEAAVIDRLFGSSVPVNSTKALTGHTFGACGAIEAAVTALSIYHGVGHGSPFLEKPLRALDFIIENRFIPIHYALTQSFAFGGHNAVLLLEKYT